MSHFYATIPTSTRKTTPTAQGSVDTGITTHTASYKGCIETRLYHTKHENGTHEDWFEVSMIPWIDKEGEPVGDSIVLASGHVGDMNSVVCPLNAPHKRY